MEGSSWAARGSLPCPRLFASYGVDGNCVRVCVAAQVTYKHDLYAAEAIIRSSHREVRLGHMVFVRRQRVPVVCVCCGCPCFPCCTAFFFLAIGCLVY